MMLKYLSILYFAVCLGVLGGEVEISVRGRGVFVRLEPRAVISLNIKNPGAEALPEGVLKIKADGLDKLVPEQVALPPVPAGGETGVELEMPTCVQPRGYRFSFEGNWRRNGEPLTRSCDKTIFVVERDRDSLPVVMWGTGKIAELKAIGFTHQLFALDPAKNVDRQILNLDAHLRSGIGAIDRAGIGPLTNQFPRVDRHGRVYPRKNLDASNPEAGRILGANARARAGVFGFHPAFEAAMIHTEVRDKTNPSFTGFEQDAYRKFSGREIPEQVNSRWSLGYQSIPDFPPLRVIPDDDPLLSYYKWFWKVGDGWNPLHGTVAGSYRGAMAKGKYFWTFHDPAVRVPPAWGGGSVDVISHWTYSYPDPLKIALATDELLAMKDGRPGQKIMKMTQAIWYRSQVAPGNDIADKPQWLIEQPEAPFISIAPDNLRESFWLKIARRLDGVMYHGYPSLVEKSQHRSYHFTNAESREVLTELTGQVAVPLGALLKELPEPAPRMALLQSFATSIFAPKQHGFGWGNSWNALLHMALQWAHYQPAVFYEEHIQRGDLDKLEVLVLAGCEILPQSVFDAITGFQKKGGIVIGDEFLPPGILPDITVKSLKYDYSRPEQSKQQLQNLGMDIRKQLRPYYESRAVADNQDIILRMRNYGNADYLFVINDRRTFGDYVGQWKKVMEKGLPNRAVVRVATNGHFAYDLVEHRAVKLTDDGGGKKSFAADLAPGGGQLIMFLEQPIDRIVLHAPEKAAPGETFPFTVSLLDPSGKPVEGLLPLELSLLDDKGKDVLSPRRPAVKNGILDNEKITLSQNLNRHSVLLQAKCLASGKTASRKITLSE